MRGALSNILWGECSSSLIFQLCFSFDFSASTDILLDMVAKIQNPKCALVHQMPFTTDQKGLAAAVEKVSEFNEV